MAAPVTELNRDWKQAAQEAGTKALLDGVLLDAAAKFLLRADVPDQAKNAVRIGLLMNFQTAHALETMEVEDFELAGELSLKAKDELTTALDRAHGRLG